MLDAVGILEGDQRGAIAGDKGLALVLDAAGGFIIYADRTLDLTSLVIDELGRRSAASSPGK